MHTEHDKPASFHGSPLEAMQAPPEEFLYLACLHEGTGVEAPDFLAVVDAEDGAIVHELPMPNVGDELHHFGWNRCSSACHGPDRSHLIVPGFRSSRIHIVNVADDPRAPRIEKVIEPEEIVRETGYTRPHTVHCMPGDNVVISMLGDADGNGAGGFAVLDAKTFEVKGRWENGGETPPLNYDFWYQPRKNVLVSSRVRRAERLREGLRPRRRRARAATAAGSTSGISSERTLEQTVDLGETGLVPLEVRWLHDPDAEQGFVGRGALERRCGASAATTAAGRADQVIAVESVELEGWPFPVPGSDHRPRPLDGRPLPLLRQLAARRPAPVRRLRPGNPKLTGQLWLGGVLGKPSDGGARAERRPEHAPALVRRAPPVRRPTRSTRPGTTSSTRSCAPGCCGSTATRTAAWRSTATSSSTSTTAPTVPRAHTRCASRTATAPRRSSSDPRAHHGDPGRGERAATRARRRGDRDRRRDRRSDDARPATPPAPSPVSRAAHVRSEPGSPAANQVR